MPVKLVDKIIAHVTSDHAIICKVIDNESHFFYAVKLIIIYGKTLLNNLQSHYNGFAE